MTDPHRPGKPLWLAYEYLAMLVGLLALAVICLAWLPFAMLFQPLLPQRLGRTAGRFIICLGFRVYLRFLSLFCACHFDLSELDGLRAEGPLILAANHPSLLDAPMIVSRLPNAVCVMKAALMDNILLGSAARLAGYIRNNAALTLVLGARDALREGGHLLIFPEGTRTSNFPLDACTAATALIAKRSRVPVQTLLIEFSTPYLGKAWPLFKRPSLPLSGRVRLGRRFPAPDKVEAFTEELEAYFRDALEVPRKPPPDAENPQ